MKAYSFKIPDFNGGFIYKSVENYHVVTRDNEGFLLNSEPVNLLQKGIKTDKGEILLIEKDQVLVMNNGDLQRADKYLFNSYLIKKAIEGKGKYFNKSIEFEQKHPRDEKGKFTLRYSPITGAELPASNGGKFSQLYTEFCNEIIGEYKTPLQGLTVKITKHDFAKFIALKGMGRNRLIEKIDDKTINWNLIESKDYPRINILKVIKEILTDPLKIKAIDNTKGNLLFMLKKNDEAYFVSFTKESEFSTAYSLNEEQIGNIKGEIIYEKEKGLLKSVSLQNSLPLSPCACLGEFQYSNVIIEDIFVKDERSVLVKAFGNLLKMPKIFGGQQQAETTQPKQMEGQERPGHKYIERKLNPNPKNPKDKYIYLYELPNGKRVWEDNEGKEVKEEKQQAGTEGKQSDYQKGETINYKGKVAKIEDRTKNMLGLRYADGSTDFVDLLSYNKNLQDQANYTIGGMVTINDTSFTVKHIDDSRSYAFLRGINGESKIIRLEQPISRAQKQEEEKPDVDKSKVNLPKLGNKEVSIHNTVLQEYNDQDEFKIMNYDYENQDEYKSFNFHSQGKGFAKINDLRFRKTEKAGDRVFQFDRAYDPASREIEITVDGIKDYKVEFEGKDFLLLDVKQNQMIVQDTETGKMFTLDPQLLKEYEDARASRLVSEKTDGGTIVYDPAEKKQFTFKPEYSQEEEANFSRRGRRINRFTTPSRPLQSEEEKSQIKAQQDEVQRKNREALDSVEYSTETAFLRGNGFKVQENPFYAMKKANFNGIEFELSAKFNPQTRKWDSEITKGRYKELQLGDQKYKLTDFDGDHVFYLDETGKEREISKEELEKRNGKNLFEPTKESKGLVSKKTFKKRLQVGDKKVPYWTEIIEADGLTPSHFYKDGQFVPNEKYSIKEAQNRIYDDKAIAVTEAIRNNPDFEQLDDNNISIVGAPITDMDYEVYGGNNRSMGIISHYDSGGQKYKNALIDNAEDLGYTAEEISKMNKPVLIRRTNISKAEAKVFGGMTNETPAKAQTRREIGKAKAVQINARPEIKNQILDAFKSVKEPNITTFKQYIDKIGDNVYDILRGSGIINDKEISAFQTDGGRLDKDAIQSIAHQLVFGGSEEFFKYVPDKVEQGLSMSLGSLLSLEGKQQINEPMDEAIKIIGRYNQQDEKGEGVFKRQYKNVYDFVNMHQDMFLAQVQNDPKVKAMIELLSEKSPNEIKQAISEYRLSMEDTMFGLGLTPDEAFEKHFPVTKFKKSRVILFRKAINTAKNILLPSKKDPNVKRWQSKIVDNEGKPLKVYHGTTANFNKFSLRKTTQESLNVFWFAKNPEEASEYLTQSGDNYFEGANIKPVYLNIKNPGNGDDFDRISEMAGVNDKKQFRKLAIQEGFDGFILDEGNTFVCLFPNQIKTAL